MRSRLQPHGRFVFPWSWAKRFGGQQLTRSHREAETPLYGGGAVSREVFDILFMSMDNVVLR